MLSRLKQSVDYAIIFGAPTLAALSMRVHPLLPVIMTIALLGMLFIASNPHLLLVLLATVPLIKGALESNFPVFETIDYTILISLAALVIFSWQLLLPQVRRYLGQYQLAISVYVIWLVWMLSSSAYAPNMENALPHVGRFAFFTTILFLGPLVLIRSSRDSRRTLIMFFVLGGIGALYLNANLLYLLASGGSMELLTRLTILEANPIASARIFAICAAMTTVLYFKAPRFSIWWVGLMMLYLVSGIFTGSRGPLVSLFIAVLIMTGINGKPAVRRAAILLAPLLVMVAVLMVFAPSGLIVRFGLAYSGDFSLADNGLARVSTALQRWQMWGMAVNLWVSDIRHFLIGAGPTGFSSISPWRNMRYPHNMPLELLAEYGLIGASVFSFHIGIIGREVFKQLRKTLGLNEQLWLAATLTMGAATMVSGDLNDNRMLWFLMSGLLATIYARRREESAVDVEVSRTGMDR